MMDEEFARGTSFLHKRDPRVKIIVALFFTLLVATSTQFPVVTVSLLCSILLLHFAQLPIAGVTKRLLLVNTFPLFLWITLPFTYGGVTLYKIGVFHVSQEGTLLALLITLKANAIIMVLIALLSTSNVAEIGHGLKKLGFPERLCFLILFSYRFIFVIYQEYVRLLRAAKIRNFRGKTNLHTYRTYGYLFGMTLIKSLNRSQRVQQAMQLRGFEGKLIPLHQCQLAKTDYIFLTSQLICILGLVFLKILW